MSNKEKTEELINLLYSYPLYFTLGGKYTSINAWFFVNSAERLSIHIEGLSIYYRVYFFDDNSSFRVEEYLNKLPKEIQKIIIFNLDLFQ